MMRPAVLALDSALERQLAFRAAADRLACQTIDLRDLGPALRLWSRPGPLRDLRSRLRDARRPAAGEVVFSGSGDFHHVTSTLVERVIEATGEDLTVLHFDNHPDWVRFQNGMHCGSWAAKVARLPSVARVVTVGVCSRDVRDPLPAEADVSVVADGLMEVYPYALADRRTTLRVGGAEWPTIESLGERAFLDLLLSRIETSNVYVTIDKDVLCEVDAVTNWDQGRATLTFIEDVVRAVAAGHRLVGADVFGDWSSQSFGRGPLAAVLKHGEAFLDQPRRASTPESTAVNERANLRLLALFAGMA